MRKTSISFETTQWLGLTMCMYCVLDLAPSMHSAHVRTRQWIWCCMYIVARQAGRRHVVHFARTHIKPLKVEVSARLWRQKANNLEKRRRCRIIITADVATITINVLQGKKSNNSAANGVEIFSVSKNVTVKPSCGRWNNTHGNSLYINRIIIGKQMNGRCCAFVHSLVISYGGNAVSFKYIF